MSFRLACDERWIIVQIGPSHQTMTLPLDNQASAG